MSHPLDGARLKIVRAQEHLDAFKREGREFLDTNPYRFESEVYGEHWWVKPILTKQPRRPLAAIVGDCVTNARAALDYILWELVQQYFDPPFDVTDFNDRRITSFPITETSLDQGYVDRINRLTKRQIPALAIGEIKAAQPDVSGNRSLWLLSTLVNIDKHRTPILAVASFSAAQIEIANYRGRNWLIRSDIIKTGAAIKTDTETLAFVRDNPMNVNVQATVQITTQDIPMPDEPLERTLEQIIETVANVIPRFDRFLV